VGTLPVEYVKCIFLHLPKTNTQAIDDLLEVLAGEPLFCLNFKNYLNSQHDMQY